MNVSELSETKQRLSAPTADRLAPLPLQLRVLSLSPSAPDLVNVALRLQAAGCHEPQFRWSSELAESLAELRHQAYDLVLMLLPAESPPFRAAAIQLVQAMRTSGHDEPVLGILEDVCEMTCGELLDLQCEVLVTPDFSNSPALLPAIRKTLYLSDVGRENQRLGVDRQRSTERDHTEALQRLEEQRKLVGSTNDDGPHAEIGGHAPPDAETLQQRLLPLYDELLKTFVMMGAGTLNSEVREFAKLLVAAGFDHRRALRLHLERVAELIAGLGRRSSRHVINRVDLLAIELLVCLGETQSSCPTDRPEADRPHATG